MLYEIPFLVRDWRRNFSSLFDLRTSTFSDRVKSTMQTVMYRRTVPAKNVSKHVFDIRLRPRDIPFSFAERHRLLVYLTNRQSPYCRVPEMTPRRIRTSIPPVSTVFNDTCLRGVRLLGQQLFSTRKSILNTRYASCRDDETVWSPPLVRIVEMIL